MEIQEFKPCPICFGINSESCETCKGVGQFPYPWVLPEDKVIRRLWTVEETAVIYTAIDGNDAYCRYAYVYGSSERSCSSVYRHWQYIHDHETTRPCWTIEETELMTEAGSVVIAISAYHHEFGTSRTETAIKMKYYRVSSSK